MYKIRTLNNIAVAGLRRLPRERYEVSSDVPRPDAIIVRSADMHSMEIPDTPAAAGAKATPVHAPRNRCRPVFHAPGANANAVKDLVAASLLLAARNICNAWDYVRKLDAEGDALSAAVAAGKKQFVGFELPGR